MGNINFSFAIGGCQISQTSLLARGPYSINPELSAWQKLFCVHLHCVWMADFCVCVWVHAHICVFHLVWNYIYALWISISFLCKVLYSWGTKLPNISHMGLYHNDLGKRFSFRKHKTAEGERVMQQKRERWWRRWDAGALTVSVKL